MTNAAETSIQALSAFTSGRLVSATSLARAASSGVGGGSCASTAPVERKTRIEASNTDVNAFKADLLQCLSAGLPPTGEREGIEVHGLKATAAVFRMPASV